MSRAGIYRHNGTEVFEMQSARAMLRAQANHLSSMLGEAGENEGGLRFEISSLRSQAAWISYYLSNSSRPSWIPTQGLAWNAKPAERCPHLAGFAPYELGPQHRCAIDSAFVNATDADMLWRDVAASLGCSHEEVAFLDWDSARFKLRLRRREGPWHRAAGTARHMLKGAEPFSAPARREMASLAGTGVIWVISIPQGVVFSTLTNLVEHLDRQIREEESWIVKNPFYEPHVRDTLGGLRRQASVLKKPQS